MSSARILLASGLVVAAALAVSGCAGNEGGRPEPRPAPAAADGSPAADKGTEVREAPPSVPTNGYDSTDPEVRKRTGEEARRRYGAKE